VMGAYGAASRITNGTIVLVDGTTGSVLLEPTFAELEAAQTTATRRHKLELELESATLQPSSTPDGTVVTLMGNVDLPEELDMASRHGAQGVGLLRTEFMVLGRA